jgi:hypothetical protein
VLERLQQRSTHAATMTSKNKSGIQYGWSIFSEKDHSMHEIQVDKLPPIMRANWHPPNLILFGHFVNSASFSFVVCLPPSKFGRVNLYSCSWVHYFFNFFLLFANLTYPTISAHFSKKKLFKFSIINL